MTDQVRGLQFKCLVVAAIRTVLVRGTTGFCPGNVGRRYASEKGDVANIGYLVRREQFAYRTPLRHISGRCDDILARPETLQQGANDAFHCALMLQVRLVADSSPEIQLMLLGNAVVCRVSTKRNKRRLYLVSER